MNAVFQTTVLLFPCKSRCFTHFSKACLQFSDSIGMPEFREKVTTFERPDSMSVCSAARCGIFNSGMQAEQFSQGQTGLNFQRKHRFIG